jgi:hypothetical protein
MTKGGETMEMKRFLHYLVVKGIVIALVSTGAIAEDKPSTSPKLSRLRNESSLLWLLKLSRTILMVLFIL